MTTFILQVTQGYCKFLNPSKNQLDGFFIFFKSNYKVTALGYKLQIKTLVIMENIVQLNFNDLQSVIKECLRDAVDEIKAIPDPPKLSDRVSLPEACEITELSRSAMYKLCMGKEVPHEKYGKRLIFSRKALQEWIRDRTIRPASAKDIMTDRLAKSAGKIH